MKDPQQSGAEREQRLRDMNEALLVSSVRQHELTEQADTSRDEAIKSRSDAESARDAANKSRDEANTSRDEANRSRAEAESCRDDAVKLAAALRDSEERYRTLFDAMDEGYCIIEVLFDARQRPVDYRFIEVNGSFERQSGMHGVVGKRMLEFVPAIEPHWLRNYGTVALTGEGIRFSGEYEGLHRFFDVYAFRTAGWPEHHVAVLFTDVTRRRRDEQALHESEDRFRTLAESTPALIWFNGPDGAEFVNRQYLEFLGVTDVDVHGYDWTRFVHPDDRDHYVSAYLRAVQERATFDAEFRFRRHDGEYRWMRSVGQPRLGPDGEIIGFAGASTDITERKGAEQAQASLAAIVTSSEDAIVGKDLAGVITSWNRGAEHLFGYAAEEVIGKSVTLLIPDDHLDEEPRILERIRRGEAVEHYETVRRRKDGSLLDISLTVSPLRDAAGRIIGASKIARDITENRRLERQTRDQATALADLHRRKDEFLAMLSHELRNPLAPIASAVQLLRLQQGSENEIERQARGIIERQVGQLKHLIDDLLEVSRITTGRIHLHRERVAVGGVVDHAVETVRPLIAQRRHTLKVSVPPEPIWLYGDAARLEQVVVNLLTNAAKYTDEGGHIWLGVQREGDAAVLRVRDSGVGIPADLLPRIFDLFTQAERSLDRSQGGLGIGLCLVHRLVELHGGTVEARSTPGQGSEFVVRLPMTSLPPPSSPNIELASPTASLRVLVVDDNVDSAESLAMLLRASRHEARTAHDGSAALEAAIDFRPDVVLLDIGLPGLNGFEVARRIRQQPTLKNIVLVAMTGYGQESDRRRSQEAGFDHHLTKPADFGKVQGILAGVEGHLTECRS